MSWLDDFLSGPGKPSKPASGGALDPGLAGILSQLGSGAAQPQRAMTVSDIEALLQGTARRSQTRQPFVGPMPAWVPGPVRQYVQQGAVDPYLGTGTTDASWRVYMGQKKRTPKRETRVIAGIDGGAPVVASNVLTGGSKRGGDRTLTLQQAVNEPYLWDQDEVAEAIKKFQAAGLTGVKDFDTLAQAWGGLVQRAGKMYSLSSGQRKVTPWDVLDLYKTEQLKAGTLSKPGPGDPGFNGRTTVVNRQVSDVDEGEAWTALRATLSNMLGRDPGDDEVRDFSYRMGHLAARNPSISKTITQYRDGQAVSSNTRTKQGFSSDDLARSAYEEAQGDPDYAEYQSATTYFNAALSALGEIGGN